MSKNEYKQKFEWAMEVINGELEAESDLLDTYLELLTNAQEAENEEDVAYWLAATTEQGAKVRTIKNIKFMVTHPDIYNS